MPKFRLRHAFVAILLLVTMLSQGTWALAGTTGSLTGYVRDANGVPVAGAKVTVLSLSEQTSTSTDASGHFSFLTLRPDTYSLSSSAANYQATSIAGITVFADQVQSVVITMPKALKTIANVVSQAASGLVKTSVGGDIYNVDPTQMQKTAALGGGGNLDNAYSAIASVPGLVVGTGGAGWNQAVVVRGNNPWFTGFEYDGIPINRAFDNYTGSTASNLGLQELQVYTGGGPSSISSSGTSGFINQVIKTGTYPGYGTLSGGLAALGAFYHSARAEVGGASPDRNFSYYFGVSGYNQAFRQIDNNNGASLLGPGSQYASYGYTTEFTAIGLGVFNICPANGVLDPAVPAQGCLPQMTGTWADTSLGDRELVGNFHFGLPRRDGQKDDVQLMWSSSALQTYNATSPNLENNINGWQVVMRGVPYCGPGGVGAGCAADAAAFGGNGAVPGTTYPIYQDSYVYNLPFGTNVAPNGTATPLQPGQYFQANTPAHAFQSQLPLNGLNDLYNNDTGALKAQFTHPFNDRSFLRLMGYSFFSDWTENGAISGYGASGGWEWDSPNYDLITHTRGAMLQYVNQISDKNLLQFTGNLTNANVNRFNHTGSGSTSTGSTALGLISLDSSGQYHCYSKVTGAVVPCYASSYTSSAAHVAAVGTLPAIPAAAAASGAYWATLIDGNASGTFNKVEPTFYSASLSDQWRPSDKIMINASLRWDRFSYKLAPANMGQNPFYAQEVANYACVNPTTGNVLVSPLAPGSYPPANPVLTNGACSAQPNGAGYVHPDCAAGDPCFSLNVPSAYAMSYFQPRISGTYTENPDTVWRFSGGRYAEPPISASVEYLYRGGSAASLWTNFMSLGTYSPFHPIPGMTSAQYDFSLEKRIHGTPLSFKITPFYSATSNWQEQSFIGAGFVTQIPVGKARSWGVETQFNYGDFNQEGLSGLVSFTYTKSQVQFQNLLGSNQINDMNQTIQNYNALTSQCAVGGKSAGTALCGTNQPAASACYASSGDATPVSCADLTAIANPYYNSPAQPLLDPSGWYDQGIYALKPGVYTGGAGFYNSPFVTNIVLNYRHQKLAITPSLQIQAGTKYGSPYDIYGVDPRNCFANQAGTGAVAAGSTTAQNCDYTQAGPGAAPAWTYLYVPNPQTGSFATYGAFTEPNIMIGNLQLSYDVSSHVTLQLTASNLFHTCFGGTQAPWTTSNPASSNNCGYYANGWYNGAGWYNGTSPTNAAANHGITPYPWEQTSYLPKFNNSIGGFIPFTLYFQAQIKL